MATTTAYLVVVSALEALGRKQKGGRWSCPCHGGADGDRSCDLQVDPDENSGVLIHCHAGCDAGQIVAALGLTWQAILGERDHHLPPPAPRLPKPVTESQVAQIHEITAREAIDFFRSDEALAKQARAFVHERYAVPEEKLFELPIGYLTKDYSTELGRVLIGSGLPREALAASGLYRVPKDGPFFHLADRILVIDDPGKHLRRVTKGRDLTDGSWIAPFGKYRWRGEEREVHPYAKNLLWASSLARLAQKGEPVFVVEGGGDGLALAGLDLPVIAAGGAAYRGVLEFARALPHPPKLVVLEDRDGAGLKGRERFVGAAKKGGIDVVACQLEGAKDVAAWLVAGGTRDRLLALAGEEVGPEIIVRRLSDVDPDYRESWIWGGRIIRGGLTMLVGDEGIGKSLLICYCLCAISRGWKLFGDAEDRPAARTLLLASEDNASKIRQRCEAIGGDLDRIDVAEFGGDMTDGDSYAFRGSTMPLERIIERHAYELVIFDPLEDYMGIGDQHAYKSTAVRRHLRPVARVAQKHDIGILLVHHSNKSIAGTLRGRLMGSGAYRSTVRSVLWLLEHPDERDKRIVYVDKTASDEDRAPTIAYKAPHVGDGGRTRRIEWIAEPIQEDIQELLRRLDDGRQAARAEKRSSKAEDAAEWLEALLLQAGGEMPSAKIYELSRSDGHSERTVRLAKDDLRLIVESRGFPRTTWWRLKPDSENGSNGVEEWRG